VARIKQSICAPMFRSLSLEQLCDAAAEIGYAAVEFWGRDENFDRQVATAKRYGLAVASFTGHSGTALNDRADHDQAERGLRASIDVAASHGIPGIICLSGNRQPGRPEAEAVEVTADGLARVAPYAERKGVNLNLEVLNSKVDHPGYDCDHTSWAVTVCEKVSSPRVKILYDIYHMQIMEGDIIRTIRSTIKWRRYGRRSHCATAARRGRPAPYSHPSPCAVAVAASRRCPCLLVTDCFVVEWPPCCAGRPPCSRACFARTTRHPGLDNERYRGLAMAPPPPEGRRMYLSCSSCVEAHRPLPEALERIADLGFRFVDPIVIEGMEHIPPSQLASSHEAGHPLDSLQRDVPDERSLLADALRLLPLHRLRTRRSPLSLPAEDRAHSLLLSNRR
jgi:hydroxypyruvate isomerase